MYKVGVVSAFKYLSIFSFGLVVAYLTSSVTFAATPSTGTRWYSSSAVARDLSTNWSSASHAAQTDYDTYTDLTVSWSTTYGGTGAVYYDQGRYGNFDNAAAFAQPFSGSTSCIDSYGYLTGYCNTTDHKTTLGYVHYNLNNANQVNINPLFVAKHETGHIFGMEHVACGTNSVMAGAMFCNPLPNNLGPDDIQSLNSWY